MLKLYIRPVWNYQIFRNWSNQKLNPFNSLKVTHSAGESANGSNSTTLFLRFAKHLAIESYKFDPLYPRTIKYSTYFPVRDLNACKDEIERTPTEQLPFLILFAFTSRTIGDPYKFIQVISEIDATCVKRISEMNNELILRVLYSLLFLFPEKLIGTHFYKSAMQHLLTNDSVGLHKEKFVQVCFYIGLMKKHVPASTLQTFKMFLKKYLEMHLDKLSKTDSAILCNAIYKTAVRVNNDYYLKSVQKELMTVDQDDELLISLVKNLRLQRVKSTEVCERLVQYCVPEFLQRVQPSSLTHVLTYFSENRWDDLCAKNIALEFKSRLEAYAKGENNNQNIRAKDICMFLWCSSQLNFRFSDSELDFFENVILNNAKNGEFINFPDMLVDCALSLWVLGKKSRPILQEIMKINEKYAVAKSNHSKADTRFTMLQSAVAIEYPLWLPSVKGFEEDRSVPSYLLQPDLVKFSEQLQSEEDIVMVKLVCPIYGINVPCICVQFRNSDSKVFVELLTEDQLLRFSREPVAILKLKQSLLNTQGYDVISVMPHHINGHYKGLKDLILKENLIDSKRKLMQSI